MTEDRRKPLEPFDLIEICLTSDELDILEQLLLAVPEQVVNSLEGEATSKLWQTLKFAHSDMDEIQKQREEWEQWKAEQDAEKGE